MPFRGCTLYWLQPLTADWVPHAQRDPATCPEPHSLPLPSHTLSSCCTKDQVTSQKACLYLVNTHSGRSVSAHSFILSLILQPGARVGQLVEEIRLRTRGGQCQGPS